MSATINRKLTTILAADAERFSAAMHADEVGTYADLHAARRIFFKLIERRGGRVANTAGDGLLAEFPSVVEAVHCAVEVQQELAERRGALNFRIGIHLGDVIVDGDDLIGEGVNLAARLQAMAEPGGVLISQQVLDQVRNKLTIGFQYLGEKRPRNLTEEVAIYRLAIGTRAATGDAAPILGDRDPLRHGTETRESPPAPGNNSIASADKRRRFKYLSYGTGAIVALNMQSGGEFWPAWPLLIAAFVYALRHSEELLERNSYKGLSIRLWVVLAFLTCVNLMSWSGFLWVMWPIVAIIGIAALKRWMPKKP